MTGTTQFYSSLSTYVNHDLEDKFPIKFFEFLIQHDLLNICLPGTLDFEVPLSTSIVDLLKAIGRKNLSGGRIFEGHINAIQLIKSFANPSQTAKWSKDVTEQKLFGVWNTQGKDGAQIVEQSDGIYELTGSKTFCSGADFIERPLVTAEWVNSSRKGWQMIILNDENTKLIKCEPEFWRPLGMKGSVSYRMTFTDIMLTADDLLGQPGDYYKQPVFSGGAIRFAAVQLGGAEAIVSEVHRVLNLSKRTNHPFQQSRMAEMTYLIETGNLWISKAARLADNSMKDDLNAGYIVAYANMTRTVIEDICLKVMQLAEKSIGSQAFLQPCPLEQLHRDLTMYLRQPGPDAALINIGEYVFGQADIINLWNLKDE